MSGQAVAEDQRIYELVRQLGAYADDRQNWRPDFAEVARVGATDEKPGPRAGDVAAPGQETHRPGRFGRHTS
jgi:hypothetical protein